LKKLNQLPILNENSFAEIYSHNKDLLKNRYIDLNKITKSEYKTFKKINLLPNGPLELTDATFSINFIELKQLISDNKIDEFFKESQISKKDKLLLYCYTGHTSALAAYFLNNLGYNTYFTSLKEVKNKNYLKFNRFPLSQKNIPLILPFKKESSDRYYIFFMFHSQEDEFCDPSNYPEDIRNRLRKIVVWPQETLKNHQCPVPEIDFNEIFNESSKIVCLNNLDCLLTQHYLDYLNLTNRIDEVFFISEDKNWVFNL
ncbi:MAG: hypothetical protein DRH33_05905, partial [Candidatus Nealsonbacteria bacterium]